MKIAKAEKFDTKISMCNDCKYSALKYIIGFDVYCSIGVKIDIMGCGCCEIDNDITKYIKKHTGNIIHKPITLDDMTVIYLFRSYFCQSELSEEETEKRIKIAKIFYEVKE